MYAYWSLCNYLFPRDKNKLPAAAVNYTKGKETILKKVKDSSAVIVEHCPLISIFSDQKWNMVIISDTRWWLSFFFLLRFISLFLRSNVSKFLFILSYTKVNCITSHTWLLGQESFDIFAAICHKNLLSKIYASLNISDFFFTPTEIFDIFRTAKKTNKLASNGQLWVDK